MTLPGQVLLGGEVLWQLSAHCLPPCLASLYAHKGPLQLTAALQHLRYARRPVKHRHHLEADSGGIIPPASLEDALLPAELVFRRDSLTLVISPHTSLAATLLNGAPHRTSSRCFTFPLSDVLCYAGEGSLFGLKESEAGDTEPSSLLEAMVAGPSLWASRGTISSTSNRDNESTVNLTSSMLRGRRRSSNSRMRAVSDPQRRSSSADSGSSSGPSETCSSSRLVWKPSFQLLICNQQAVNYCTKFECFWASRRLTRWAVRRSAFPWAPAIFMRSLFNTSSSPSPDNNSPTAPIRTLFADQEDSALWSNDPCLPSLGTRWRHYPTHLDPRTPFQETSSFDIRPAAVVGNNTPSTSCSSGAFDCGCCDSVGSTMAFPSELLMDAGGRPKGLLVIFETSELRDLFSLLLMLARAQTYGFYESLALMDLYRISELDTRDVCVVTETASCCDVPSTEATTRAAAAVPDSCTFIPPDPTHVEARVYWQDMLSRTETMNNLLVERATKLDTSPVIPPQRSVSGLLLSRIFNKKEFEHPAKVAQTTLTRFAGWTSIIHAKYLPMGVAETQRNFGEEDVRRALIKNSHWSSVANSFWTERVTQMNSACRPDEVEASSSEGSGLVHERRGSVMSDIVSCTQECAICLASFDREADLAARFPSCCHFFHPTCLFKWVAHQEAKGRWWENGLSTSSDAWADNWQEVEPPLRISPTVVQSHSVMNRIERRRRLVLARPTAEVPPAPLRPITIRCPLCRSAHGGC